MFPLPRTAKISHTDCKSIPESLRKNVFLKMRKNEIKNERRDLNLKENPANDFDKGIDEWIFFRNEKGLLTYCGKCTHCTENCKQSFRARVILCPKYRDRQYEYKKPP